jgi:hypothetical protein
MQYAILAISTIALIVFIRILAGLSYIARYVTIDRHRRTIETMFADDLAAALQDLFSRAPEDPHDHEAWFSYLQTSRETWEQVQYELFHYLELRGGTSQAAAETV